MPIADDHRQTGVALVQVDDEQLPRQVAINNSRQSPCQQRVFQIFSAVKNCYRWPGPRGALPQNDSAIGPAETITLTHRIPVTGNGDRLFRGRTA
ncbi:MAG: hypothetical protein ACKO6F_12545 [Cyanobium sp.]